MTISIDGFSCYLFSPNEGVVTHVHQEVIENPALALHDPYKAAGSPVAELGFADLESQPTTVVMVGGELLAELYRITIAGNS